MVTVRRREAIMRRTGRARPRIFFPFFPLFFPLSFHLFPLSEDGERGALLGPIMPVWDREGVEGYKTKLGP